MYSSQDVANKIKVLAKSHKIAINKLLQECALSKNTLSSMQSGGYFPRVEALAKIADYLDCSVDYLLGRTDCPDLMVKDKDGNITLIEFKQTQNTYKAKIAASDGSFNKEITLTDSDIQKIDALPDVEDI